MPTWGKSFAGLFIAELLAIAGFATAAPVIPLYLRELGLVEPARLNYWNGLVNSMTALSMAILAPIWGALADVYGRRLMLLRAIVGGAVLMVALALTNQPWEVLLVRTLQGSVTGTVAAATALTAAIVPATEAGYRLGLLQMGIFLGNSIGPLVGGVVRDLAGSRVNFLVSGLFLGLAATVVIATVREDFCPQRRSGSVLRNAVPDLSIFSKNVALVSIFAVVFAVQLANSVVGPILPLIVLDMQGADQGVGSLTGLIIGASAVAGALGAALIGKVSSRLGYGRALLVCIAGSFLFYIPQGLATGPYGLLVLRIGSGFFLGGTMPSAGALIAKLCARSKQGATYGMSASISAVGMAVGPALGAVVATGAGYPAVFWVTSGILAVTGFAVAATVRSRGPDQAIDEAAEGGEAHACVDEY